MYNEDHGKTFNNIFSQEMYYAIFCNQSKKMRYKRLNTQDRLTVPMISYQFNMYYKCYVQFFTLFNATFQKN